LLATGGDKRSELTPAVPAITERGVAGFPNYGWKGVIAPSEHAALGSG
jgi:tripartite-type tricarboxylate transporter receptor subunit TctC